MKHFVLAKHLIHYGNAETNTLKAKQSQWKSSLKNDISYLEKTPEYLCIFSRNNSCLSIELAKKITTLGLPEMFISSS